ncbi:hypothetical protein HPT27_07160 [Permianibacter sp. IMCC34836]|uniref:SRPBCC family protein n=1 Tax=Permianibacter fluminis TaxID=2738515 RepID=UPI00155596CA|nr:SRPBCC family protein [Permianibacter fluminis]NQD36801.1 hypothetical protein [Permianibacter fluminis]
MTAVASPIASNSAPVQHGSFVLERHFAATPAQVFAAWATLEAKRQWFFCSDWPAAQHELDFRIGGRERNRTGPVGGPVHEYDALYHDIVPDQRIILSYSMAIGGSRISVSLLTVDLQAAGSGCQMTLTEQLAVLDDRYPIAERKHGTNEGLNNLAAYLQHA